jgi:hypothetical protein
VEDEEIVEREEEEEADDEVLVRLLSHSSHCDDESPWLQETRFPPVF